MNNEEKSRTQSTESISHNNGKTSEKAKRLGYRFDLLTITLRSGLAGFCGFFTAGLFVGLIEGSKFSLSTKFDSYFTLGLSLVLFVGFWVLFTSIKLFENKT